MRNEIWKDIPNYEGLYQVSNLGRILAKATKTNQYHKKGEIYEPKYRFNTRKSNTKGGLGGYCIIALYKNGNRKDIALHRIVAEVFIPNKTNFKSTPDEDRETINLEDLQINHKDGNKQNNCVSNLEWCTNSYNQKEAYRLRLHKTKKGKEHKLSKPIVQYDLQGNFIKEWINISTADKFYAGRSGSSISACLRNKTKTAYGYKWKYKEMV